MSNITFKYLFAKDYNPEYINGAYGGVGPKGEIIINFYMERLPVPYEEVNSILPNGTLERISITPTDHDNNIIRFVKSGVVLNLENAILIKDFLDTQISRLEELSKGTNDKK